MNESQVKDRLQTVLDPHFEDDLLSLNLVNAIKVDEQDETIHISLALGAPFSPEESDIALIFGQFLRRATIRLN